MNSAAGLFKKSFKRCAYAISALLLLLFSYLVLAVVLGLWPVNRDFRSSPDGVDIYVASNGVHTDLILPRVVLDIDWRQRLPQAMLHAQPAAQAYLAFGWGERRFYLDTPTWQDLRATTALRALTGLNQTVLHVEAMAQPTSNASSRHLRISAAQYRDLVSYIVANLAVDEHGGAVAIAEAHYNDHDSFFEANGRYSLFMTCNEWARRGLTSAGIRGPLWSPFDWALLYQLPTAS